MEEVIRVTTGSLAITITLPPAATLAGKFVTLFKVDAGVGSFSIVGLINGYAYWQISNQFGYVRLFGNGASYDVVGSG
jgi:hypothetical protein